jgi:hypothetical protein
MKRACFTKPNKHEDLSCEFHSASKNKYHRMIQDKINAFGSFMAVAFLLLFVSCNDEWNNHYVYEPSQTTKSRLGEYIGTRPELSTFYTMLQISGYDTILNSSQSYTVWAPINESLQNIDLNNKQAVTNIVTNHITRFSIPTSGIQSKYIKMLNNKRVEFSYHEPDFQFGGNNLLVHDVLGANGIVHTISNYVPFTFNIWQYIQDTPGLDSLEKYISSQNVKIFDDVNSVEIGTDTLGNAIYDSVFYETNVLFDNLGDLNSEDSVYTTIVPDNTAWIEAYNRIKTYYIANPTRSDAKLIQKSFTQFSLVQDMVFRNRVYQPVTADSLISTYGNVFQQPGYLFQDGQQHILSNGLANVTNLMKYKATESWHKELRLEAETTKGRTSSNANVYIYSSYGSGLDVSKSKYIQIDPTTESSISKIYVDFTIPNTLSAKYNIYCVFVPGSIVDPADIKPFKASFYLTYVGSNGALVLRKSLPVTNNTSNPNGMTKMLIAKNFVFPFCDLSLENNYVPLVKLRVQNEVTVAQEKAKTFSRKMRIDCIILEPVE